MEPGQDNRTLKRLLEELDGLLTEEHLALRKLDRSGIELATQKKLDLSALIGEARAKSPVTSDCKELLEKVKASAMTNQLLLVHARACVHGALALVHQQPPEIGPALGRTKTTSPLAVSIKG